MKCEKCGHKNEDGYLFCEQCGEKLTDFDDSIKICSKCGNPNKSSHEFCTECGSPLHSRKNKKKRIWFFVGVLFLVSSIGFGFFVWNEQHSKKEEVSSAVDEEETEKPIYLTKDEYCAYRVLDTVALYKAAGGEKISDQALTKGEEVWVAKSADCVENEEVWGMVEDKWCLIQGPNQKNLEKITWKDSNQFFTGNTYEALSNQSIYNEPTTSAKSNGEIQKGDFIQFSKVQENQFGTVWGQSDSGEWMMLKSENIEYFKEKEKESNLDDQWSNSSNISLPIIEKVRAKRNYSGPAVMEMILSLHGVNVSQETMAQEVGLTNGGVTDYEKMGTVLTNYLKKNRVPAEYVGTYVEPYDMANFNFQDLKYVLNKNLEDGYTTIVCVNQKDLNGTNDIVYGLIYGRNHSGLEPKYELFLPVESGQSYLLTLEDLEKNMKNCRFICYLS